MIKEFEHIHNKAIFDTFNEALNLFRPYFLLGGPPYTWSKNEKNLAIIKIDEKNINFVIQKTFGKVSEWATFLCGIMPEIENKDRNIKDLEKGEGPLSVTKKIVENVEP